MDTLPILVPVVAGIVLCPTVILCTCLRQLQRRVDALEETSRVTAAVPQAPPPPLPTGFLGGVTYGGTAPPLPTAPLASAGAAYPYFTQMPPPPPQLQPLPYALQQRRVV